jgi:hypothetical protein
MKCLISWVAVALAATMASAASAQPTPAGVARAVSLFDEAKRELDAGNVERACGLFVDSYRSDPQVGTLLNTALCHEKAGKTASAWAEFTSVVSLAGRAGQAKRSEFASTHARALEPKLSRVRFDIQETAADLALTVDGTPIAVDAARATAIPVDPGAHVVRATAKAKLPWEGKLVVAAGPSTAALTVASLAAAPVAPLLVVAPSPSPSPSPSGDAMTANDLPSRPPPLRTLAYASAGAAVVALVVGGVTGGLAISSQSRADRDCTGAVCRTPEGLDANDRAHTFATVSSIGLVAGGALVVTSVVLFLVSPRSSASAAGAARLATPGVFVSF